VTADYYSILGVSPSAESEVIEAAWKVLMKKYHPDTNHSPNAALQAQLINEAYGTLGDPIKRHIYDLERAEPASREKVYPPPPPPPPKRHRATSGAKGPSSNTNILELSKVTLSIIYLFVRFFLLPGKILAELFYLWPKKGQIWASGRRRKHPFVHLFYSIIFWALILIFCIGRPPSLQGAPTPAIGQSANSRAVGWSSKRVPTKDGTDPAQTVAEPPTDLGDTMDNIPASTTEQRELSLSDPTP